MKIEELVKLAEAGYTPAMVRELLSLNVAETPVPANEVSTSPDTAKTEPVQTETVAPEPEAKKEPEIDYKKLYEETKADLDKSRTALLRQNAAGQSNEKSLDEKVFDILASYF